jgi:hypothetical protein
MHEPLVTLEDSRRDTKMKIQCEGLSVIPERLAPRGIIVEVDSLAQLEELPLPLTRDSYNAFRSFEAPTERIVAREYLSESAARWSDPTILCPEMPLPSSFTAGVRLLAPLGETWSDIAVAVVHAGRRNSVTPIHFDWDHAWVAHACLKGRKRFLLLPPEAGWLLVPVINTSALRIPWFSADDRAEVLAQLGGIEVDLAAGEGLLFPSMFWHGVLYDESSLSVSVRFERHGGGRPFQVFPRSWWLQRMVWLLFRDGYGSPADAFFARYLEALSARGSWRDRYDRVREVCHDALRHAGERRGVKEWVGENFSPERALAEDDLRVSYAAMPSTRAAVGQDVEEIVSYLFEGAPSLPKDARRLAAHALQTRQGLRPRRGIVKITSMKEAS